MAPTLWRDNTRLLVLVIAFCHSRRAILAQPVRRVNSLQPTNDLQIDGLRHRKRRDFAATAFWWAIEGSNL